MAIDSRVIMAQYLSAVWGIVISSLWSVQAGSCSYAEIEAPEEDELTLPEEEFNEGMNNHHPDSSNDYELHATRFLYLFGCGMIMGIFAVVFRIICTTAGYLPQLVASQHVRQTESSDAAVANHDCSEDDQFDQNEKEKLGEIDRADSNNNLLQQQQWVMKQVSESGEGVAMLLLKKKEKRKLRRQARAAEVLLPGIKRFRYYVLKYCQLSIQWLSLKFILIINRLKKSVQKSPEKRLPRQSANARRIELMKSTRKAKARPRHSLNYGNPQ